MNGERRQQVLALYGVVVAAHRRPGLTRACAKPLAVDDFTKEVYMNVLPVMRKQASDSLERLLFSDVRTTPAQSIDGQMM